MEQITFNSQVMILEIEVELIGTNIKRLIQNQFNIKIDHTDKDEKII